MSAERFRDLAVDWALPDGHPPVGSLLIARLVGKGGEVSGLISVCDTQGRTFSIEEEALLVQLAALTSSALQHIEARADAERRANELDTVFAAMTDPVAVFSADLVVLRANPAAAAVLGFEPTGLTWSEIEKPHLGPPCRTGALMPLTNTLPSGHSAASRRRASRSPWSMAWAER